MKKLFIFLLLSIFGWSNAQEILAQELYQGKISDKMNITFYFKKLEDGCPHVYVQAIYRYTNNAEGE